MQLALPFTEAIALAEAKEPRPPMVRELRCEGSTIHADIDPRAIPDLPTALRLPGRPRVQPGRPARA